jgi:hypothetical protein
MGLIAELVEPDLLLPEQTRSIDRILAGISCTLWRRIASEFRAQTGHDRAQSAAELLLASSMLMAHRGSFELIGRLLRLRAVHLGAQISAI